MPVGALRAGSVAALVASAAALVACGGRATGGAGGRDAGSETGGASGGGAQAAAGQDGQGPGADGGRGGSSTAFAHPGCLSTRADLARMKAKVAAGAEPWLGSWKRLIANPHAQLGYADNPQATLCAGGVCTPENYMTLAHDAAAAYQLALRYQISGDDRYAARATQILDDWAAKLTALTGDSNAGLRAGLYGNQLAIAAELLRDDPRWDPSAFKKLLLEVFYPIDADFLVRHNGACEGNYWANWDLSHIAAMLAIGVFTDRRDIFDAGVGYARHGAGEGSLDHAIYQVHPEGLGQWQESGRDQGHATLGPMLLAVASEIAWNQGQDLYGYDGDRFLLGSEYVAAYNLGSLVPFVAYAYQSGSAAACKLTVQSTVSEASRGIMRAGWEIIFNHYVNRRGLAAPWSAQYAAASRPEGGGGDYGPNSGGFDSLGFTTLTHTLDSSASMPAPEGLRTWVQGHQIALSWVGSARASSYRVFRRRESQASATLLATLDGGVTRYVDPGLVAGERVFYAVSAREAAAESARTAEVAVVPDEQLFGSVIGTEGSFGSTGATRDLAFDGVLETFFDGPDGVSWVGLDLGVGATATVSALAYAPRKGLASRMVGGTFQGSPTADFSAGVVDLFSVAEAPVEGALTRQTISSAQAFRYLRYISKSNGHGDVAEIVFHGKSAGVVPPASPSGLVAAPASGSHAVVLQWSAVPEAELYRVVRSSQSDPLPLVLGFTSSPAFTDQAAQAQTTYQYVVTASNRMGASADSAAAAVSTGP